MAIDATRPGAGTDDRLVMPDGLVSRQLFIDPALYQQELERIFTRCWLFLGHESQVAHPGDYLTTYMGEDPIILSRDQHGHLHAYLNSCLHRGMKVCRTDVGNATYFRCPYHGWTYDNEGALVGVPQFQEGYREELDREQWALYKVPRVASYGGLIFGCWDAGVVSLDEYLGELRWYLDIQIERPLGGLEVLPGAQRYLIGGNWKIAADNFAGDEYHVMFAHGSAFKLQTRMSASRIPPEAMYTVSFDHGHGIGSLAIRGERYTADLAMAESLGPEAVEYVEECHRRLQERLSPEQVQVHSLGHGNTFPNFSWNDFSALQPSGLYMWHPKGPDRMELWQWCMIDRAAPQILKDKARIEFTQVQSAAGFFGQDDSENFEQVTEATRGFVARQRHFNYQMAQSHDGQVQVAGYPGRFAQHYSEFCQRRFYQRWATLMADGSPPEATR